MKALFIAATLVLASVSTATAQAQRSTDKHVGWCLVWFAVDKNDVNKMTPAGRSPCYTVDKPTITSMAAKRNVNTDVTIYSYEKCAL